jgi:plasmid stability protein
LADRFREIQAPSFPSPGRDIIDNIMASLLIRKLDDRTKSRLRVRAAQHGRSMEEEAREILRSAVAASSPQPGNLAEAIRRRFAKFGGVDLPKIERDLPRDPPDFS